jgi:outer membrane murein-binding lipoprotein Lpp
MSNLAAFIEEAPPSKTLTKEHRKTLFAKKTDVEVLSRYDRNQTCKSVRAELFKLATDLAVSGYAVPSVGGPLDGLPMTTTAHARTLADRIGFAVMPWHYLSDQMHPSDYETRRRIDVLNEQSLELWVMAPVVGYSLKKHLESDDDLPVHVPEDVSQAFMALSMSIPVFRAMQHQLDELRNHVRDYYDRVQNLAAEVKALTTRVDDMAAHAARERARQRAEANEVKRRQEEILTWYRGHSDPLVLILPPGKTIRDDTPAFIGPCWGELPKNIVKMLALTPRRSPPALKAKGK